MEEERAPLLNTRCLEYLPSNQDNAQQTCPGCDVETTAIITVCSSVNNTPTHSAVTATNNVPMPASAIRSQDAKWGVGEEKSVSIDVTPRVIYSLLLPRTFLWKIIVLIVLQESLVLADGKTVVSHSGLPTHYYQHQQPGPEHHEKPSDNPEEGLYPRINVQCIILLIIFLGFDQDDFGSCVCGGLLTSLSVIIVIVTLPFSLCVCLKVM